MKSAIVILFASLATGCVSHSERSVSVHTQDGLSPATAVVLGFGSIQEGVAAEDAWLQKHYPGFRRCSGTTSPIAAGKEDEEIVHFGHHTDVVDGRILSVLCVVLPSGEEREFFFDVTAIWNAQKEEANQSAQTTPVSAPR